MNARILMVEDEDAIRAPLAAALRAAGYEVAERAGGAGFEATLEAFRPDLVLLDLNLPDGRDGYELARVVRQRDDSAVLMLTARDMVADRVDGFAAGADDYVIKPFATVEILARVAALLRRLGRIPSVIQVGDLVVDDEAKVAVRSGALLDLTSTEFRLLAYLIGNRGRVLSKTQLLTQVWGYDEYDPNLVEVHMSALRRKIERHGPRLIHTARGLGYVLRP
jgi:two-component system, OmpR family, response regulator